MMRICLSRLSEKNVLRYVCCLGSSFLLITSFRLILIRCTGWQCVDTSRKYYMDAHIASTDFVQAGNSKRKFVTSWCCFEEKPSPRLGNLLFMYASMMGIAHANNMTEVVLAGTPLTQFFKLRSYITNDMKPILNASKDYKENRGGAKCDDDLFNLDTRWNAKLNGFLTCRMYFKPVEDKVRQSLVFSDHIQSKATQFLRDSVPLIWKNSNVTFVRVGIHARRGDLLYKDRIYRGFLSAPASYYANAMAYFKNKFKFVLFVVCSDGIAWTKENIKGEHVVYSEGHSSVVDMAILSSCDHVIMSVGTYGWWSAWLANGETIYYDNWPAPLSWLDDTTNKKDLFPSWWIPMV